MEPNGAVARILIADDHELARAGLQLMLAGEPGMHVVGQAANGREALEQCERLQPDLVMMDMRMPDMDGLAATRAISQAFPHIRVIIVTVYENPDYVLEALKCGAAGYLLKGATRRELVRAVRAVLAGDSFLQPELTAQVVQRLANSPGSASPDSLTRLSTREVEVLRLLAQGQTNREIARQLVVGVTTVKTHVEHIIAKLQVVDRTQAAVRAIELGLVTPTPPIPAHF